MNLKRLMEPRMLLWLAAALAVALLLMLAGGGKDAGLASQEEQRIAEVLSAMAGAGRVEVALFYGGEADALGTRTAGPNGRGGRGRGGGRPVGSAVADPRSAHAAGPARERRGCVCDGGGTPMNTKKGVPGGDAQNNGPLPGCAGACWPRWSLRQRRWRGCACLRSCRRMCRRIRRSQAPACRKRPRQPPRRSAPHGKPPTTRMWPPSPRFWTAARQMRKPARRPPHGWISWWPIIRASWDWRRRSIRRDSRPVWCFAKRRAHGDRRFLRDDRRNQRGHSFALRRAYRHRGGEHPHHGAGDALTPLGRQASPHAASGAIMGR